MNLSISALMHDLETANVQKTPSPSRPVLVVTFCINNQLSSTAGGNQREASSPKWSTEDSTKALHSILYLMSGGQEPPRN